MILILTRTPTTHSVAVVSSLLVSIHNLVSPVSLIRTIPHDGPSAREVPQPPTPHPHRPTVLLLEAVVG